MITKKLAFYFFAIYFIYFVFYSLLHHKTKYCFGADSIFLFFAGIFRFPVYEKEVFTKTSVSGQFSSKITESLKFYLVRSDKIDV